MLGSPLGALRRQEEGGALSCKWLHNSLSYFLNTKTGVGRLMIRSRGSLQAYNEGKGAFLRKVENLWPKIRAISLKFFLFVFL